MPRRLHTVLLCSVLLGGSVVAAGVAAPASARVQAAPRVESVRQIARQNVAPQPESEPDTLVEPDVAVSPVNPRIAVAAAHDGRFPDGGAVAIAYAWTRDGGRTWRHAPVPGLTTATGGTYLRASDPVVAFGPDGTAYLSTLLFDMPGCRSAVAVSRSVDGGRTFGPPRLVHASEVCQYSDDKNWLVVDTSARSPHRGRLYQFWTPFLSDARGTFLAAPQVLRWSDDKGRSWSPTVTVSGPAGETQNSQPGIQRDGTIVDTYIRYSSASRVEEPEHAIGLERIAAAPRAEAAGDRLVARRSRDGGRTWSPEVTVTDDVGTGPSDIRCCLPSATADPRTGRLYAVWNSVSPELVRLSTSADGVHWSAPVPVNRDAAPGRPTVNADVTAYGGGVYVSYGVRDTAVEAGRYVQQQISASRDGGRTFGAPLRVGPASDLRYAAIARGIFPGDYIGTASAPGRVYAVWCRSSTPPVASATYHQTLYAAVLRP
ncbi:MAG TPA: hypothetical protein VGD11_10320 [Mycobacteriales bacterium]